MLAATKPIRVFLEETLVGRSCDEGRSFVHIPVRWREASRQKNNKELTIKPTKKKMKLVTSSMQMGVTIGYQGSVELVDIGESSQSRGRNKLIRNRIPMPTRTGVGPQYSRPRRLNPKSPSHRDERQNIRFAEQL
jgi:hypothetical protein